MHQSSISVRAIRWLNGLLLCCLYPVHAAVGQPAQQAYVTTQHLSTVVAIDTEGDVVTAEIPLSIGSADVAVAPNGKRAYVVDASTDSLTEVDLAAFAVTGRIPVGHRPSRIAITPDGRWAYVVGSPTVAVDLASGSRLFITDLPIVDLAIDNDGRFVFFALGQSIENIGLAVFDSATGTVTPAVPGYAAAGVALSFDGRYVYLAGNSPGSVNTRVLTVDAVSLAVLHDVLVPTWPYLGLMDDIAVTPEGKTLYVTASPYTDAGTLLVLDAATAEVRKVLHNVYGRLAMAPAGERLYLSNNQSGNLLMLDTATDLVTASMSIGTGHAALPRHSMASSCRLQRTMAFTRSTRSRTAWWEGFQAAPARLGSLRAPTGTSSTSPTTRQGMSALSTRSSGGSSAVFRPAASRWGSSWPRTAGACM